MLGLYIVIIASNCILHARAAPRGGLEGTVPLHNYGVVLKAHLWSCTLCCV